MANTFKDPNRFYQATSEKTLLLSMAKLIATVESTSLTLAAPRKNFARTRVRKLYWQCRLARCQKMFVYLYDLLECV